ncbi:hypothetical protein ACFXIQ_004206 [Vibrio vulnificus]
MIEKKLKNAGIIESNPYVVAFNGVIEELLQGLVVVEHLKNDVTSRKKLEDLDKLYSYLSECKKIRNRQSTCPVFRNGVEDIIFRVCNVLDNGGGYERWIEDTQAVHASSRKRDTNPLWPDVVREQAREFGFKFDSLGRASLGYSHYCLLKLYNARTQVFRTIEDLLSFDPQETIESVISDVVSNYGISELDGEIKDNIYLVCKINNIIRQAVACKLLEIIKPVKETLNLLYDVRSYTHIKATSEKENWEKDFSHEANIIDVITLKIAKEDLESAHQSSVSHMVNQDILNAIWEEVYPQEYFLRRDDALHDSIVNQYAFWCSFKKEKISSLKNHADRKLSHKLLLRGLKFSHWLEDNKDKQTVVEAARAYVKTCENMEISANTVKQAYEAVKSTAKKEVPQLISRQCMWMLKMPIKEGIFVFSPLYMMRFNQIKEFVDSYNSIIEEPKLSHQYDDLVKLADSIMSSYNNAESGFKNSGIILKEFSRYDRQYKEKKLEELNDRARFI